MDIFLISISRIGYNARKLCPRRADKTNNEKITHYIECLCYLGSWRCDACFLYLYEHDYLSAWNDTLWIHKAFQSVCGEFFLCVCIPSLIRFIPLCVAGFCCESQLDCFTLFCMCVSVIFKRFFALYLSLSFSLAPSHTLRLARYIFDILFIYISHSLRFHCDSW